MRFPESSVSQPPVVVDLRKGKWGSLFEKVRSKVAPADPQLGEHPLKQIVAVLTRLGCTDAVIEYPYHDQDLTYDYLHDYGEAFNDCGKDTARVHFFRVDTALEYDALAHQLQAFSTKDENNREQKERYLGFMVVRPTRKACIGRTIVRFPAPPAGRTEHVHARGKYHTNLYGVDLEISGVPFMHQDQSSHVCAGIALWALCYDLHRRYRTPRLFPRQVTEIATAASPLSGAGHGLDPREMARVLRHVGCTVDLTRVSLEDKPVRQRRGLLRSFVNVAYGYVESGAPVLLGYRFKGESVGHVVLLIGHDLDTRRAIPENALPERNTTKDKDKKENENENKDHVERIFESDYVRNFIVQDDRRGPYQTLRIWNETGVGASRKDAHPDPRILEDAEWLFLMPGLTGTARLKYRVVSDLITNTFTRLAARKPAFDPWYLASLQDGRARERLYVQPARRFKEALLDTRAGRTGLPDVHVKTYLDLCLPRHVYVCDFCAPSRKDPTQLCVHGEMLIDASAPRYCRDTAILAMRVENMLWVLGERELIIAKRYNLENPPRAPAYD